MEKNIVKILSIRHITHDVLQIETEKPDNFTFIPGQATDISLTKNGWEDKKKPFTITSLPQDNNLQFTIKTYPEKNGVTNELLQLRKNDTLNLYDVFGTINYKEEGLFIAGGAGVTPFISIFRYLKSVNLIGNNILLFANKTRNDIILREELEGMLGKNLINILSDEIVEGYYNGFISEAIIKEYLPVNSKNIYVCGPPQMIRLTEQILAGMNFDLSNVIKES